MDKKISRIKLNFGPNTEKLEGSMVDAVNGFIHNILGPENKWHDTFSPYSISKLHGGSYDKETKTTNYPNGGYLVVSSSNSDFTDDLLCGMLSAMDAKLLSMPYLGYTRYNVTTFPDYDIVHIENLRLKRLDKEITFMDANYIDDLRKHCIKKLMNNGISQEEAESLAFEPVSMDKWRVEYVKMKTGTPRQNVTPSSNITLKVSGSRVARAKMFELGYGLSTGSCFGFAFTGGEVRRNNNLLV